MIGILDLDPKQEKETIMASSRNLDHHCKSTKQIKQNSLLAKFLDNFDKVDYALQEQLPNPVIIDTVNDPKSLPASEDSCLDNLGKTIVFSAYLLQDKVSNEYGEEEDFPREP